MQSTPSEVVFIEADYEEVILPSIWEQQTFIDKAGPEIINQMWAFADKGGRDVCLIPEVTGLVQELWRNEWSKAKKARRIFYVNRCYRYERPQAGRYREFTQFGVELLGGNPGTDRQEVVDLLDVCLKRIPNLSYEFSDGVKRGLSYYTEDGFEVECSELGAQKQIAGGGRYAEGIGWAIGVDRLILAASQSSQTPSVTPTESSRS